MLKQCFVDQQDKEALQQQVALLKLASQDGVVAIQKQLADAMAERDVAVEQVKAAEQQAAAETAHRVRLEGSAHDLQQQLSRQTAEAAKAHQNCKQLQEQVRLCSLLCCEWASELPALEWTVSAFPVLHWPESHAATCRLDEGFES